MDTNLGFNGSKIQLNFMLTKQFLAINFSRNGFIKLAPGARRSRLTTQHRLIQTLIQILATGLSLRSWRT
jgi:hypothetical protein